MSTPSSVRRRQFAMGVALLGCSFASTDSLGGVVTPLNFTTVNALTVTMSAGASSFTYTLPAASGGFSYANSSGGIDRSVQASAYVSASYDVVAIALITDPTFYTSASGSGTISLTFSADVTFLDLGLFSTGTGSGWKYNGFAVNDGDLFVASATPYVFTIDYSYVGAATGQFLSYGLFTLASSAVPLPGAAGLAACGLFGLGRRRR